MYYNQYRSHSILDYVALAAFTAECTASAWLTAQPQQYIEQNEDHPLIAVGT